MKKKLIITSLFNIVPYLILLTHYMLEYLNIFDIGTSLGYVYLTIFILIFFLNVYYIPQILVLKMPEPRLLESRVIGVALSIGLNVILLISIWYTAVQIDEIIRGY